MKESGGESAKFYTHLVVVDSRLVEVLRGEPLSNEKYINPKLITWGDAIRTRFKGNYPGFIEDIGACHATGVLKVGSVYRQGSNYHLQVFLKECKYRKRDISFESLLSDDETDDDMFN